MQWLSNTLAHPVIVLIGYLFGLAGVIVSVVFYFKQVKDKRPRWASRTAVVIDGKKPEADAINGKLAVTWDGHSVEQLTVTRLLIGNAGRETIRCADIAAADPVRVIPAEGVQILACEVCEVCTPAINATAEKHADSSIRLGFEYLDEGDAFVLRVVHTGGYEGLSVAGTIMGAGAVRYCRSSIPSSAKMWIGWPLLSLGILGCGVAGNYFQRITGMALAGGLVTGTAMVICLLLTMAVASAVERRFMDEARLRCTLDRR